MISLHPSRQARRALAAVVLALGLGAFPNPAWGQQARGPAAARERLLQGYQLKQRGQLREALPHLLESYRLEPQLQTLINLADCEERLGLLVESQSHWLMARDAAARDGDTRIKQGAEARLGALGPRVPHLTLYLSPTAPANAQVYRDELLLPRTSLGTALPVNAGEHTILVRVPGHDDWKYLVKLAERDNQIVTVNVGPATKPSAAAGSQAPPETASGAAPGAAPSPVAPPATATATPQPTPAPAPAPAPAPPPPLPVGQQQPLLDEPATSAPASTGSTQRVIGLAVGAAGVVSFGVSALFFQKASTDINALSNGRQLAKDDLLVTNVTLFTGSILLTGGIVLFFTAPRAPKPGAVRVVPALGFATNRPILGALGQF